MLKRVYLGVSWLAIFSIVVLAVLISVGRMLSPAVQGYLPMIQDKATEALGQKVTIKSIDVSWHGIAPALRLHDVSVRNASDDGNVIFVKKINVRPDVFKLLFEQQPYPSLISFSGARFPLHLLEDKRLIVPGLELLENASADKSEETDIEELMGRLSGVSLELVNSRIDWRSELTNSDFIFTRIHAHLAVDEDLLLVEADVGLPERLGERLRLNARIEGPLWIPSGWDASIYAHAKGLHFSALSRESLLRVAEMKDGHGDMEAWLDWGQQGLKDFRGNFKLHDLSWAHAKGQDDYRLDRTSGRFMFRRQASGWTLDLSRFELERDGYRWPSSSVSLRVTSNEQVSRYQLDADYLDLGQITEFISSRVELKDDQRLWVERLKPRGALRDIALNVLLEDKALDQLIASGQFLDVGWEPYKKIPGINGLDGQFSLDEDDGSFLLVTEDALVDYPWLFKDKLTVRNLRGEFDWSRQDKKISLRGRTIKVSNEDIRGEGQFDLELGDGPGQMDMQFAFFDGNGKQVARYLPAGILRPKTYDWLVMALQDGFVPEGQLLFKGKFRDFPFTNGEGIFITRFTARDVLLKYGKGWPTIEGLSGEVEFRNNSMNIVADGGRIYDSRIDGGEVSIKDLFAARLLIDARATGPMANVFSFLSDSPLGVGKEAILNDLESRGNSKLTLGIDIPLSKKLEQGVRVNGQLDVAGSSIRFKQQDLLFKDLTGQLKFTEQSAHADDVTASFDRVPVNVNASTQTDGRIKVLVEGVLPATSIVRHLEPHIQKRFSGESLWVASLTIPPMGKGGHGYPHLSLQSDLVGTSSTLPFPLYKEQGVAWPVQVGMYLGRDELQQVSIDLRNRLSTQVELAASGGAAINRADIRFGSARAALPKQGIQIRGIVDRINVDDWVDLFSEPGNTRKAQSDGALDQLNKLALHANTLVFGGREYNNFKINALKKQEVWSALIDSPWVLGTVSGSVEDFSNRPLKLELDYLDLDHSDLTRQGQEPLKPEDFPAVTMQVGQLKFAGREFSKVNLSTRQLRNGLRIHALSFDADGVSARVNGDWRSVGSNKEQTTKLTYNLQFTDLGKASKFIGWESGLEKGDGSLIGSASWDGGPADFSYANNLQGRVDVDLKKGVITGVDAGAGKILGLFNLDMLGSRLRLDFSDLPEEGFGYKTWTAEVRVNGSKLTSRDMVLDGSAGKLRLDGVADMANREMDVKLDVMPDLYAGVPIAGAIVAGPAAGAALYVLGKLPGVSQALEEGGKIEYKLTGAWEEPTVERLTVITEQEEDESLF
ncbi:MAG: YhdP family protein [Gammaproteobacteria bacterium]|nr:YhdP family protein [Gammaproteobacteria bacterium]